jgi:hypothetical protein
MIRLLNVFYKNGCYRRKSNNHVLALISRSTLSEDLIDTDNDLQLFNLNHLLIYLHGRHRLKVNRRFLTENDR